MSYSPFKMKGAPMIQGSNSHKQAVEASPVKQLGLIKMGLKFGAKKGKKLYKKAKQAYKDVKDVITGGPNKPKKKYGERGQYNRKEDMIKADEKYKQGSGSN